MVLALAAAFISANAQVKSISAATSALDKAKADTENPKKADKPATWIKYGKALLDAYLAPAGDGWLGASRQDLALVLINDKPASAEFVTVGGNQMIKETFETRNYYYDASSQDPAAQVLQMIEITKPIQADALQQSVVAYEKAAELDVKGSKKKEIGEALKDLKDRLIREAYTAYTLGDFVKASDCFESAANACRNEFAGGTVDYELLYNAGFTSLASGMNAKAKALFLSCYEGGYYGEGGELYAKLAEIANAEGDAEKGKDYLEEGFKKFPQSQAILVGLINYYMNTGGNTDRLFELLDEAKKNEPENASLYYVEGNIREKLGMVDEGVAAYRKCLEIDPNYYFGYIGEGILYYNYGLKLAAEASEEMNDAKYRALEAQYYDAMKMALGPFETALGLVGDDFELRNGILEYLKNICYRLSTLGDEYSAKYEAYKSMEQN